MTHEINWRSAITPAAIAQQQFSYEGRWIRNWFSNMLPFDEPLVFQGISYRTPENLYQAMKTHDPADRARIAGLSPAQAKQAGRQAVIRPDWEQVKERYMAAALRHKFEPGTSWHDKLMVTGNNPIVEFNNWHDNFWGACVCERCQVKPKQNRLGVLLMGLRAEYQSAQPPGGLGQEDAASGQRTKQQRPLPPQTVEPTGQVRAAAPAFITELALNQVFVFGSNTEGRHGKGAALTAFGTSHPKRRGAVGKWAVYGQARGLMQGHEGMSYGVVTKDLSRGVRSIPLVDIEEQIDALLQLASERPELDFLVTPFGTALAGYSNAEIVRLWRGKPVPSNVRLPQVWLETI